MSSVDNVGRSYGTLLDGAVAPSSYRRCSSSQPGCFKPEIAMVPTAVCLRCQPSRADSSTQAQWSDSDSYSISVEHDGGFAAQYAYLIAVVSPSACPKISSSRWRYSQPVLCSLTSTSAEERRINTTSVSEGGESTNILSSEGPCTTTPGLSSFCFSHRS